MLILPEEAVTVAEEVFPHLLKDKEEHLKAEEAKLRHPEVQQYLALIRAAGVMVSQKRKPPRKLRRAITAMYNRLNRRGMLPSVLRAK